MKHTSIIERALLIILDLIDEPRTMKALVEKHKCHADTVKNIFQHLKNVGIDVICSGYPEYQYRIDEIRRRIRRDSPEKKANLRKAQQAYLRKKLKDPEYRKQQNARLSEYRKKRYVNDPEYREKKKEQSRLFFRKKYQNDPDFREKDISRHKKKAATD